MPIPPYEGRRTYFFFADVEPKEVMTFGVEAGIQLDDDSTLEVLGHALAYWAIAEERDVWTLRAFVQDVFDVTLAIYALIRLDRGDRRDAHEEQRRVADDTIADVEASGLWPGEVVTEVTPAGPFWEAEPEHQDYLERYPNGYTCHFPRPGWVLPRRTESVPG
jgi:Peptide methionine sulfoxide reductase